jgi:hypothetical protein
LNSNLENRYLEKEYCSSSSFSDENNNNEDNNSKDKDNNDISNNYNIALFACGKCKFQLFEWKDLCHGQVKSTFY